MSVLKESIPYIFFIMLIAISISSKKKDRIPYIALSIYFLLHIITGMYDIKSVNGTAGYLQEYISIEVGMYRLDGAFAMIFGILTIKYKQAKYYALLLCCAIFTHSMLIYDLQEESSWLSSFIYDYCDELIIFIWLTMMVTARDGLIKAFNSISLLLRGNYVYRIRGGKNSFRTSKDEKSP